MSEQEIKGQTTHAQLFYQGNYDLYNPEAIIQAFILHFVMPDMTTGATSESMGKQLWILNI